MFKALREKTNALLDKAEEAADAVSKKVVELKGTASELSSELFSKEQITIDINKNFMRVFCLKNSIPEEYENGGIRMVAPVLMIPSSLFLKDDSTLPETVTIADLEKVYDILVAHIRQEPYYEECKNRGVICIRGYWIWAHFDLLKYLELYEPV